MDLLAEAFRQRKVRHADATAIACHVTISPLGLPSLDCPATAGQGGFSSLEILVPTVGRTGIQKTVAKCQRGWAFFIGDMMQHDASIFTCCDEKLKDTIIVITCGITSEGFRKLLKGARPRLLTVPKREKVIEAWREC